MNHTVIAALLSLALAAGAQAQLLGISSEPAALARAALGGEAGATIFVSGPPSRRTYSHDGQTGGFQALLSLSADGPLRCLAFPGPTDCV